MGEAKVAEAQQPVAERLSGCPGRQRQRGPGEPLSLAEKGVQGRGARQSNRGKEGLGPGQMGPEGKKGHFSGSSCRVGIAPQKPAWTL